MTMVELIHYINSVSWIMNHDDQIQLPVDTEKFVYL